MISGTTPPGDGDRNSRSKGLAKLLSRWKRIGYGRRVAICAVLYVAVAFIVVLNAPRWLLGEWIPDASAEDRGKLLGTAGNLVLLALGGVIAVVTVGLSLARHRQEVDAADRDRQRLEHDRDRERARIEEVAHQRRTDTERVLRERFVTTVQLLSDLAPVNRQAAMYALGALADDWDAFGKSDEVQVCIEVLTGYLRAPRSKEMLLPLEAEAMHGMPPEDYYYARRTNPQEIAVKQAGFTVIRNHLVYGAPRNWHERHLNLSGAHIDFPVTLLSPVIRGNGVLDFRDVRISDEGRIDLSGMLIDRAGRVLFDDAVLLKSGVVDLLGLTATDRGTLRLTNMWISDGRVEMSRSSVSNFGSILCNGINVSHEGRLSVSGMTVSNGGFLNLAESSIRRKGLLDARKLSVGDEGTVEFDNSILEDDGSIDLSRTAVGGQGRLGLDGVEVKSEGLINLQGVVVGDGAVADLEAIYVRDGGAMRRPNGTVVLGAERR